MASFSIFDGSIVPRTLAGGEFGFIAQTGSLAVTAGTAITTSGSLQVTVFGSVFSTGNALLHSGDNLSLFIGQLGAMNSATTDTIRVNFTDSVFISNDGSLHSGSDALDIRASDAGGRISIVNAGTISGKSDGIVTSSGEELTRILNTGSIMGADGGIDHLAGIAVLINRGVIFGDAYGYSGAAEVDTVKNYGTILGGVLGEAGDDVVRNAGVIDFVELGDGDDRYDGRRGFVEEAVRGGLGKDDLRGGDDFDFLEGEENGDALRGRGGDDVLEGGSGADLLIGGFGDDVLSGGTGADIFKFGKGHGADMITDLRAADKIDLKALDIESFRDDVKVHIKAVAGGSVIDLSKDFGVTISLEGVLVSELTAGDFLI